MPITRRTVLKSSLALTGVGGFHSFLSAQEPRTPDRVDPPAGERPQRDNRVKVLNPRARVPMSFIIDDSTCLVNLAHFCIPHFAEVYPDRYKQDWRRLPREIPDKFVRKFAAWCDEQGVKGKYSIVPYPACVGWVDRDMPGWTRRELRDSIRVVQDELTPNWDIHPEMVTHTFVINTKTGRPYEPRTADYLENTGWSVGRSADELADYMSYALRILRNAGFQCEGVTTPGGFGNQARRALAQATFESCRDVYRAEIPHYFRHLFTDDRSVAPRVEYARGLKSKDPSCVVSVIGCTGDWFGGWDGLKPGSVDRFITSDLKAGRLIEVIERGEPAIMVCHWPGIYFNGQEIGFNIFKEAVRRVQARYDHLIWMKLSEISRYWAAKELTEIKMVGTTVRLNAPFASPNFTVQVQAQGVTKVHFRAGGDKKVLRRLDKDLALEEAAFTEPQNGKVNICFALPKGESELVIS